MKGKWESTTAGELEVGDIWTHALKDGEATNAVFMRVDSDETKLPWPIVGVCVWAKRCWINKVGQIRGTSEEDVVWKLVG